MLEDDIKTNILIAAKEEFMLNGFNGASIRNIAQKANLTTGAIYNRFIGKDELFEALVGKRAKELLDCFNFSQDEFMKLDPKEQEEIMYSYTEDKVTKMIDIIYSDLEIFDIIINKSVGSRYEFYIDNMVDREVESTLAFMEVLKKMGHKVSAVDITLVHMICSAMFNLFFEPIRHKMKKEDAIKYVNEAFKFFNAGWDAIFN